MIRSDRPDPPQADAGPAESKSTTRSPLRMIVLIWLAWAVLMLGFQEFVTTRIDIPGPDFSMDWTPGATGTNANAGFPYLDDPTLDSHVAWDT